MKDAQIIYLILDALYEKAETAGIWIDSGGFHIRKTPEWLTDGYSVNDRPWLRLVDSPAEEGA